MNAPQAAPAQPYVTARPAATVLLVRDNPFEVLMVRRHPKQVFSSALVFPGGLVDDSDHSDEWLPLLGGAETLSASERALRIAAFRETFEETAMFLARDAAGLHLPCPVAPHERRSARFLDLVAESGGKLWLDELAHFAHWITPRRAPKRFDTHFFVAVAPHDQEACCDGQESMALEWLPPAKVAERETADANGILFPTRLNLAVLARNADVASALHAARNRTVVTVEPRAERQQDGVLISIRADAGYDETENFVPDFLQ